MIESHSYLSWPNIFVLKKKYMKKLILLAILVYLEYYKLRHWWQSKRSKKTLCKSDFFLVRIQQMFTCLSSVKSGLLFMSPAQHLEMIL